MICLAKLAVENGYLSSEEDEGVIEPKMNGMLNHSLRADGSIDLNNSVKARDRRRKHNDSVCGSFLVLLLTNSSSVYEYIFTHG